MSVQAVGEVKTFVDEDIVELLSDTLERARAGEVTGVLLVVQDRKGATYQCVSIKDRYSLTGYLFHALHQLQTD